MKKYKKINPINLMIILIVELIFIEILILNKMLTPFDSSEILKQPQHIVSLPSSEKKIEMYLAELETTKSVKKRLNASLETEKTSANNVEEESQKDENLYVGKVDDTKVITNSDSKKSRLDVKKQILKNSEIQKEESNRLVTDTEKAQSTDTKEPLSERIEPINSETNKIEKVEQQETKIEKTDNVKNIITLSANRIKLDDFTKNGRAYLYDLEAEDTSEVGSLVWEIDSPDTTNLFFDQTSGGTARIQYYEAINYGDVVITVTNTTTGATATCILDTSIADLNKPVDENNIIEFTIDGKTYLAEKGMNWIEWANSSYNSDFAFAQSYLFQDVDQGNNIYLIQKDFAQKHNYNDNPKNIDGIGNVFVVYGTPNYVTVVNKTNLASCEEISEGQAYNCKVIWLGDYGELPLVL